MKKRRVVIAAVLFIIGMAVFLMMSGAPLRVKVVSAVTDLFLVIVATYFTSATGLSPAKRMYGLAVGVGIVSVFTTWLSSKVIAALMPLEPIYFWMDLAGSTIKATLVVGIVWLIDFVIEGVVRRRSREPHSESLT